MEDVKRAGLARSIGVSNFNEDLLNGLYALLLNVKPVVNQVEFQRLNWNHLYEDCKERGLLLAVHNLLTREIGIDTRVLSEDPITKNLAIKYKKTPAQLRLKLLIRKDILIIMKTSNLRKINQEMEAFDLDMSEEDVQEMANIVEDYRYALTHPRYDEY